MEDYSDFLNIVLIAQRLEKIHLVNFDAATNERDVKIRMVLELIRTTINRFKMALIVPKLFENPRILGKHLLGTKYEECFYLIKQYAEEKRGKPQPSAADPSMNRLIDYLMDRSDLLQYLPNWVNDLGKVDKILIKCMENISETATVNFLKTAKLLVDNERTIHDLYLANEEAKVNAVACERQLRIKKMKFLWKSAAKSGIIMNLEEELAFLKYDFHMRVKKEMIIGDSNIKQIQLITANKQKELEEEVNNIRINYHKDLLKNLGKEKEAKNEKNKSLLQLQAIIQKYDQTLLEKEEEELALNEILEQLQKEMVEFMADYNREENMYEELFVKKDEELRRQHESEVLDFVMNRAAKIIQRAYRNYLRQFNQTIKKQNRSAKAKNDKGPTKDKAQAKGKKPKKSAKK